MSSSDPGTHVWRRILLRLVVAVVVLGAVYVGLAVWAGRQVASGTTVAGVNIGGLSMDQARSTLKKGLSTTAEKPVTLQAGAETTTIKPQDSGLSLDLDATLRGLAERSFEPQEIWRKLTGGGARPLRVAVDRPQLEASLTKAATRVDQKGHEGSITFEDGDVHTALPVQGRKLDVKDTADVIATSWPRQPDVKAVLSVAEPKTSAQTIKAAEKSFAKPAMSGPVTVKFGKKQKPLQLTTTQLSRLLTVKADGKGHLAPRLDAKALLTLVRHTRPDVERRPVNATVRLVSGKPRVIPAVKGKVLDGAALHRAVFAALTSKSRVANAKLAAKAPSFTTAEAKKLGVKQVVSEFTSHLPGGAENAGRTHNIKTALGHINGTLVKPGGQFSLLGILGTFTKAKGYVEAHVISDGRLVNALGGGISQVSTTVFNTSYFAGVQLDEHTPHSFYISRYPVGREATLWRPTIDNKWTNNTGHGILVQTWVSGQDIHMRFWGTKTFSVSSDTGPRRNITAPKTIHDNSGKCVPQYPVEGFDITVKRTVKKGGKVVGRNVFNTHYSPEDRVICG